MTCVPTLCRSGYSIVFPISFTLMAIEFGRFVVGHEILHSGEAGMKE